MNDDGNKLSGALQENVLTLLCFDDKYCKLIRGAVKPSLFESSIFRDFATAAIDFIDQFDEAIKDHLPDAVEEVLNGDDGRKAAIYKRLLENLYESKEHVNPAYVMSQLHRFVRLQGLKSTIIKATEALADNRVDEAEVELQKGLSAQVVAFESGLDLSDARALVQVLDMPEEEGFDLGIEELDRQGIIPRRKELFTLVAARGRGKSWFASHAAKRALLARWGVVVITMEMSERRYGARMLQSFFSLTRRESEVQTTRLVRDKDGVLLDVAREKMEKLALMNPLDRPKIEAKVKREFKRRQNFRIKEFPSGVLDLPMLRAYLEGLERYDKIMPDLLIIDYPDLMKVDPKNLRADLGAITVGLRGLAVERNMAVIALSQGNRESETANLITGTHVAEDISKLATADTLITYTQTASEHKLGLARLFVEKSRNETAKMQVLITQNYASGQFCLDSMMLDADYWDMIKDRDSGGRPKRRRDEEEEA